MLEPIHSLDDILQFINRTVETKRKYGSSISIVQIEAQVGISQGLISRWKHHHGTPKFTTILKILDILNVELLLRSDIETGEDVVQEFVCPTETITKETITENLSYKLEVQAK